MGFKKYFLVVCFILMISTLVGCSDQKYPENTIAVINNQIISTDMTKAEINDREISLEISHKMKELWASENAQTPKEIMLSAWGVIEKDLNKGQSRYLNYLNSQEKPLSESEAFNKVAREQVLYEKAVKGGFLVTDERARKSQIEGDEVTRKVMNEREEDKAKYAAALRIEDEVFKKYGFDSRVDYWDEHSPIAAKASTIQFMKNEFDKKTKQLNPKLDGLNSSLIEQNAWEDYTEYLLKKSKIEVFMDKYTVEFTGEAWTHGDLDLS